MKNPLVRGGALVATTALGLSMAYAPTASAVVAAPTGSDPSAAAVGATYLAAQPGADGLITAYYVYQGTQGSYEDVGLTIDSATSLAAVGGQAAKVATLTKAIAANGDGYTTSFGTTYANAAGKLASFLLEQGSTGAATTSAVQKVQDSVSTTAPIAGRVEDQPVTADDSASPLGQAYAAEALLLAGSGSAQSALSFLLKQQCAAGYFRSGFTSDKTATDQTCDGAPAGEKTPDVDTTAFAVLDLQSQKGAAAVASSLSKATSWLLTQQAADGSFNSGNANSTGLAARALGISGQMAAATKAASWLRGRQLANAGTCAPYAAKDNGAITLDDLGYKNASSGPLDQVDNSTATRATAQALPGLLYAAGGDKAGVTTIAPATKHAFIKAGSKQGVTLAGAPGNTLCVTTLGVSGQTRIVLPASGSVVIPVTVPDATNPTTIAVKDVSGTLASFVFDVLGQKALKLRTAKKVEHGSSATVVVKGLAAKEKVRIYLGKKLVRSGRANGHGVFKRHYAVNHKVGNAKLKVLGQFGGLRRDVQKIRVVR